MSNPLQSQFVSSSINDSLSTNNLTVQQILDCNQNMVSAMTSAMEVTITSLTERMDLHVNKLTAAVNSMSSTTSIIWVKMDRTSTFVKIQNVLII